MLKLAYDFSRRAVTTYRNKPIADPAERACCEWGVEDLCRNLSPVVRTNDYARLADSVSSVANQHKHSRGRGFQEHLQGVAKLLQSWEQAPLTVQIGLLHSAYSTQQYPYGLYGYAQRSELASLIGEDAERLVFVFCSHDRVDLYSQAVELCRAGKGLPEQGLVLRNALTGTTHQVPAEMIAPLMMVHAADLVEQMDGFNFEIIAALLAGASSVGGAASEALPMPACFELLMARGMHGDSLSISIDAKRGTLGLAPVLGLNRSLLRDRFRLLGLLRGKGPLNDQQRQWLRGVDERLPGLFEVPWIRLMRDGSGCPTDASDWLLEARARHAAWGVPWLKRPFDGNTQYQSLILQGAPWGQSTDSELA